MAKMGALVLMMVAAMTMMHVACAQQTTSCTAAQAQLAPCLGFYTNNTRPDSSCCNPLLNLTASDPSCICQLGSTISSSVPVNTTRVMEILQQCNVNISLLPCPSLIETVAPASSPLPIAFANALEGRNIVVQLSMALYAFILLFFLV